MKSLKMLGFFTAVFLLAGQASAQSADHSEISVDGKSEGNHDLDCRVIQPWPAEGGPTDAPYPIIVWANGWDQGNVVGEFTTLGYKPGLIEWALDGPYIVIAANQWSVRDADVLNCLEWLLDQDSAGGLYEGLIDRDHIGLAGHSQGGGAVIKAGDGGRGDIAITATIPMNPYGPNWARFQEQDGPMMLLGGTNDTTTPTSSFLQVWQDVEDNDQGGLLAELDGGTHNSEAWAPLDDPDNPRDHNFGQYQEVTELWWQFYLNGDDSAWKDLRDILDADPWMTWYSPAP